MKTQRSKRRSSSNNGGAFTNSESLNALEQQVISVAEQLGRLAGTAQARADHWLEQPIFQSQLTRIRDRASQLLGRLRMHTQEVQHEEQRVREVRRKKASSSGKKRQRVPSRRGKSARARQG